MKYIISANLAFILSLFTIAQEPILADKVIAVVGDKIILKSELEVQYQQFLNSEQSPAEAKTVKCDILERMLEQKLLLEQAIFDSIQVSSDEVESEIDRRIRYFTSLIGSEEALEEYYGKTILEIKDGFRSDIQQQLLSNRMQAGITQGLKVTPSEVKAFFEKIPEDSLPYYNVELEIAQIIMFPKKSNIQKELAKEKISSIRKRIVDGEEFETLALLYSEDPGSASKGGELGFMKRGQLVSEFEAVAFDLEEGEVSSVVETVYGYHVIQLIERLGQKVNVRHILVKVPTTSFELKKAKKDLDSIAVLIRNDSISFEEAVSKFSDDEQTKYNGGNLLNNRTGNYKFESTEIDPTIYFAIENMQVGDVSDPISYITQDGKQGYRIVKLKSQTKPHRANLDQDYQKIQEMALLEKQKKIMDQWIKNKIKKYYISIEESESDCDNLAIWKQQK